MLEDLNVQDLIQSGTNKRRRLYDSSFSELRAVLEWQFFKRGKTVLALPAHNSSRECFLCRGINQNLTLKESLTAPTVVSRSTVTLTLAWFS
ncbi:hypothetical protein B9Q11_01055 [Candidatus Marsarchaeota G2 archaeon ECH_B_SAG-F08]|uniref:Uncharacterized protein n=7 Tax=Candidatus Marsarchaeota TaxID=1978152 RepID=A0A2R6AHR9_9ARCH|nr:MAG: hypothetical protein B9Q01_03330 [Candidatus Marsarchaeota G1 archaeon OSP_D]PSN85924.1 MAG: hypothetical protein B9Q02_04405 [Candidatus Marsarchaeota G1 archaeon BE_D]PSN87085.1 MAG: hypothetical protein B9P99_06870 [Candidatus Marsarchaeota G1 archaeon OSP_B]PSN88597.1 MAG: hypothetical protein B9Q00_04775 [Candidatus Marsarchaeota G1 archaeon OSP_C]PSN99300.1 MAG: hypothetical protein B9Q11_01055 [Candidatus Marsarchaeota G2 archaeon ECH_B_SAG-F08]PSO02475.1 MAG: hypothetical prote